MADLKVWTGMDQHETMKRAFLRRKRRGGDDLGGGGGGGKGGEREEGVKTMKR